MKERQILFSAQMVRALLAGTKTKTRRVANPQPIGRVGTLKASTGTTFLQDYDGSSGEHLVCRYGSAGDSLWVREAFHPMRFRGGGRGAEESPTISAADYAVLRDGGQVYRVEFGSPPVRYVPPLAKYAPGAFVGTKYRPGIHMPRWASRLTLEITEVRVERLQEITEEDARAEGVTPFVYDPNGDSFETSKDVHRSAFEHLWGQINGPESWTLNPWVWAISFKQVAP